MGEHQYQRTDALSFWLYTPDTLKTLPWISNDAVYYYSYNPDNQNKYVIVKWGNIQNISVKKKTLIEEFRQILKSFDVEFDERFIFKPLE